MEYTRDKHILVVTDSYPPEVRSAAQLMKDMAEGLGENGYKVSVITSYPKYNLAGGEEKTFPKVREENGVRVIRVKTLPHHKVNFIVRGLAQITMPFIFMYGLGKYIQEPIDAVITHTPPLPLYKIGKKVKRAYGALNVLNVHDIFPQNAVDLGVMNNKLLVKFFEKMEKKAYRSADVLVVPSLNHKEFLEEKRGISGERIEVVEHWINMSEFKGRKSIGEYRKKYGLEDKIIFLFAGVLGPSQGLEMIVRAARELKGYEDIHFLFVGEGTAEDNLRSMVDEYSLDNVSFRPFVPSDKYPDLVKDCDVCILTLTSKNTTPAVPAKLMGYMASGMPVAAFVHKESYAHNIVHEAGCGVSAPSDNEEEIVRSLKYLYDNRGKWEVFGNNAREYTEKHFTKEKAVESMEKILRKKIL